MWNVAVLEAERLGHLIGKRSKAGTQNQPDVGAAEAAAAEELGGLHDLIEVVTVPTRVHR